jgi:hypothetical protein
MFCCASAVLPLFHHVSPPHRDRGIRQRLTAALPVADLEEVSTTAARARPSQIIRSLPPAQGVLIDTSLPPVVLVPDAEMPLPHIMAAVQWLQRQVYLLLMPPQKHLAQLRCVPALASLFVAAVRTRVPAGQTLVLSGIGAGGVVAHEMAVQLQRAGEQVRASTDTLGQLYSCL